MRNEKIYIQDILAAIQAIEMFVENIDFDLFCHDDKTSSAVFRKFEIIGEAAKNTSDQLKKKYPEIPWKEMAGMRDRLIHFYFGINYSLVWETIQIWLPRLKVAFYQILKDWPN